MRRLLAITLLFATIGPLQAQGTIEIADRANVRIVTSLGEIVVELDANRAPLTVQHFLQHAVDGYYEGTIFHRIAAGFIAQGGGFLPDLSEKVTDRDLPNESGNGLSNLRGTIGMARGNDPHSARTQFYFNLVDNGNSLDPRPSRWGYAVFGKVVEGLEVMDRIGSVPTGASGVFERDLPIEPVIIERIELIRE